MPYKDIEKKREHSKEYQKNNYEKIKEKKNERRRMRYILNKDQEIERKKLYARNKRKSDPSFRFIENLRRRQRYVIKGKTSTTKGLGCTKQELEKHLSYYFTEGMTLENHGWGKGKWHIDHIFPLSSYEEDENEDWKVDSEYNKLLIHFTNLQPLWHDDNLSKGKKVTG